MMNITPPQGEGNGSVAVGAFPPAAVTKVTALSSRYVAKLRADEANDEWRRQHIGAHNLKHRLPLPPFWRSRFGVSAPAALLLLSFQWWFQRGYAMKDGERYVAATGAEWQSRAGVTPDEWTRALASVAPLVTSKISGWAGHKSTFLRPTETFMEVFGLSLDVYDTLGPVLQRKAVKGRPPAGATAPKNKPFSDAEQEAYDRWTDAVGNWPK